MNKSEFIEVVKEVGEFSSKKEAEKALTAVLDSVVKTLSDNGSIELVGFGKFENVVQKGKEGVSPGGNGAKYKTEDKYVPKFKAGKALKDSVAKISVNKK